MLMLTPAKVKEAQEIIKKYMKVLRYVVSGDGTITTATLKKYGIPQGFQPLLEYAFKYGVLEKQGKVLSSMKPVDVEKLLSNVKLNSTHQMAIEYARLNAAQGIDTLTNTIITRVTSLCVVQGLSEREAIREVVTAGLEQSETRSKVKQALQDATQDFKRDWDRVAHTEMWNAKCQGEAEAIRSGDSVLSVAGEDTLVFKRPAPDACIHCIRLYLEADGKTPKLFKLSELTDNGNNYYKKTADWLPTVGTLHPNCRCPLSVMPTGMEFDSSGNLVAKKVEVTE